LKPDGVVPPREKSPRHVRTEKERKKVTVFSILVASFLFAVRQRREKTDMNASNTKRSYNQTDKQQGLLFYILHIQNVFRGACTQQKPKVEKDRP
jgi:hypothetical protein